MEDVSHVLLGCEVVKAVMGKIRQLWNFDIPPLLLVDDIQGQLNSTPFSKACKNVLDAIIKMTLWLLWNFRYRYVLIVLGIEMIRFLMTLSFSRY